MSSYFAAFWRHVNDCDVCSHGTLGICDIGDRLLDVAIAAGKRARA